MSINFIATYCSTVTFEGYLVNVVSIVIMRIKWKLYYGWAFDLSLAIPIATLLE